VALAGQIGALREAFTPVPKLIEVGVVGLHLQQLLEDRHQWSLSHANALSTKTRARIATDHPDQVAPRTAAMRGAQRSAVAWSRAAMRPGDGWSWYSGYRYPTIVAAVG
jgi:hypothetical protein